MDYEAISEGVLSGVLCKTCTGFIMEDGGSGYARNCSDCEEDVDD